MKVSKKTVETVSVRLTEADVRLALCDFIKLNGHDGARPDQILIHIEDGEITASVETVTETGGAPKTKRTPRVAHGPAVLLPGRSDSADGEF